MNQTVVTLILSLVVTLHNAQRLAPVPLLTELSGHLGVDYLGAGNLFSAHLLGTALANLAVGLWADRDDNKRLIALGAGLGLVLSAVFALTRSYHLALAARFGLGVAGSLIFVPTVRFLVASFPQAKRGLAMGFLEMGAGLGIVLALIGLPLLAGRLSLAWTYLSLPAFAAAILVLVLLALPSTRPEKSQMIRRQVGSLIRSRTFWQLGAFQFLNMIVLYVIIGWLPTFLRLEMGYTAAGAGVLSALANVGLAVFSPLAGLASDKLGRRKPVILTGAVLSLFCLAVLLVTREPAAVLAAIMVLGATLALTVPLTAIMVGESLREVGAGLALAVINTIGRVSASVPGSVGGYLLQATGSFGAVWLLALICGLARIVPLLAVKEPRLRPPE